MTTPPSAARQGDINALISSLKTNGIWQKLDALWLLAAHDSQAASLNWKSSSFTLSPVNSPTFTTDRGYNGDGAVSYVDLMFNPSTSAGLYALNDACLGAWSLTVGTVTAHNAGWNDGTNGASLRTKSSASNRFESRINMTQAASASNGNTTITGAGLYAAERTSSVNMENFVNGVSYPVANQASTALVNDTFKLGRASSTGYTPTQFAAAFVGSSLGAAQHAALYSALSAYMSAVGAA